MRGRHGPSHRAQREPFKSARITGPPARQGNPKHQTFRHGGPVKRRTAHINPACRHCTFYNCGRPVRHSSQPTNISPRLSSDTPGTRITRTSFLFFQPLTPRVMPGIELEKVDFSTVPPDLREATGKEMRPWCHAQRHRQTHGSSGIPWLREPLCRLQEATIYGQLPPSGTCFVTTTMRNSRICDACYKKSNADAKRPRRVHRRSNAGAKTSNVDVKRPENLPRRRSYRPFTKFQLDAACSMM